MTENEKRIQQFMLNACVCGAKQWAFAGFCDVIFQPDETQMRFIRRRVAKIVCESCSLLREFAWTSEASSQTAVDDSTAPASHEAPSQSPPLP